MKSLLSLLVSISFVLTVQAANINNAVTYAVEDAALKSVAELEKRELPVQRIAFLGFTGKHKIVEEIFRTGLVRTQGTYQFFIRNESELERLVEEIEFGERRQSIMDAKTLQRLGKIKGVDAVMYGRMVTFSEKENQASARIILSLADVETAELLWTATVTGKYSPDNGSQSLSKKTIHSTRRAAFSISSVISQLRDTNIITLPFTGGFDSQSDVLWNEIGQQVTSDSLTIYSEPLTFDNQQLRDLTSRLSISGQDRTSNVDLRQIMNQLDQLYDIQPSSSNTGRSRTIAYCTGRIISDQTNPEMVSVTYSIREVGTNKVLASGTAVGEYVQTAALENETTNQWVQRLWHSNSIAICVAALVIFIVFVRFIFSPFVRIR